MENPRSNSWNPLPSPAFYMPMMSIQAGLSEPPPLGRFLGLPLEVTVSVGADAQLGGGGGGNVWRAGRTEAPCVVLSLLPALPGRSLLTLFAQSSCQHNWQTGYSSSWKHLSRRNQDTPLKPAKLPPASPAQHENKQLFPQIVWVDGESQNLGTEII